ncbi:MAG: GAF domain-containing protein [Solirubrobacterales bacterium]
MKRIDGGDGGRAPTIRSKLAMLVVACLTPAFVATTLLLYSAYERERSQLEREELQAVRALALLVDRHLASVLAEAQVLASSPHLQTGDLAAFHAQARAVLHDRIGTIVVLSDASGQQLVNTVRPFGDALATHGNPQQLRRVFDTGRPVISDLFIGGVLHRPVLAVGVPVFRDGKVVYDLSIGILPESLGVLWEQQRLPPDWIAAVFDTQGSIVTRTHESEKYLGKKGTPILVERMRASEEGLSVNNTLEGMPVLGAFSRSRISQWSVAIGVPTDVLFGPLRRSLMLFGTLVAALIATGVGLAWIIGGRIAGAVRALTEPALALGSGAPVVVPPLHLKEADEVARALRAASDLLRQRTAERDHAKEGKQLLQARLRLADLSTAQSLHDLLVATLDEACTLTGAEIGFYHFVLSDQNTLSLQAWSTRTTHEFCSAVAESQHYDVAQAGVWAEAVRQKASVVYNDYPSMPERRGLPEGHAEVRRLMSVPIMRDGRVMAVIGVGNKAEPFDQRDLEVVEALAGMAWDLAERKRAENALAERTQLVQRRYESLRALNDIAALAPAGADEQLTRALVLGAKHLGLPLGIISRIEGETYTILDHCAPDGAGLSDGQVFALGSTYCSLTLQAKDVVAIPHMGRSAFAGHPCYREFQLEAYIGAPIMVGGTPYGTVNFSSPTPYDRAFDDGDAEFMRLLARWVSSVIERQLAQSQITLARDAAEERAKELAVSNNDLEQFAYVASHDLREPLRMVNSYLALIERRYADKLDEDGREFIGYARNGALRMNRLILDLLEYARVGRHGEAPEPVPLAEAAAEALRNLQASAEAVGATVVIAPTQATATGNRAEMVRLFQNLIGNAIKYRAADRAPRIEVDWQAADDRWIVTVKDNGIGIPPEFRRDIFKIFKRLHTAQQYEGTGIGLAVCEKIVKNLGGEIWVDPGPTEGTAFRFTVPAAA